MLSKQLLVPFLALFLAISAYGQADDPTLFSVNGNPVKVSEFKYIYTKTNQEKADFSKASLNEYLDLYVKFKLKVQKARDMHLDTVPALKMELDGYRRQLANSYLVDKEVTEKLIHEAYDRMLQDAEISHIFVACDKNAKAVDTLVAYNKCMDIIKAIQGGADFEKTAAEKSEDKSVKDNKGYLGFVTALLPDGFYNLEKAIYNGKPGTILGPIRSNSGYHVIKLISFRPARGEMEVSQILFRKSEVEAKNKDLKARVDSVFNALKGNGDWNALCLKYSDDKMTSAKGGYVGYFGINKYQRTFEDAAFALTKDNEISAPVETSIGWHIIKRISARPIGTFEQARRALNERVKRDSRSEIAKQSMINRIKKEGGYTENTALLEKWTAALPDSFLTFRWKPNTEKSQEALFQFANGKKYTVADFEDYCNRASRQRMRATGTPVAEVVNSLFKTWTDESSMAYEETQLDKKYPDFKSLMREYEEGIMLFDATKQLVWDRASTDSVGLEKYFNANLKTKYQWDERAVVSQYTLKSDDATLLSKVRDLATDKPSDAVLKKINKKGEVLSVMEKTYEKGKNKDLADIWRAGSLSKPNVDIANKVSSFLKIEKILPPTAKTLSEARGYAVADYQDYLEKQWVEELKKQYNVKINEEVLNGMVKKP